MRLVLQKKHRKQQTCLFGFQDAGYVIDTVEAIQRIVQEENPTIRTKASWALGNLSDALILTPNSIISEISAALLLKLFHIAITCSQDNDKIKTNGVRTLGNLLQVVDGALLTDPRFEEITARACSVLIGTANVASNMKVRWNACYALASVLRSCHLFENRSIAFRRMFAVLIELVVGFKNFKVRINAAVALAAPRSREFYGEFFIGVWIAFMKALETSQNMDDFTEYQHRDHLVEQVFIII